MNQRLWSGRGSIQPPNSVGCWEGGGVQGCVCVCESECVCVSVCVCERVCECVCVSEWVCVWVCGCVVCWVCIAVRELSLFAESKGHSPLQCSGGFSLWWFLLFWSTVSRLPRLQLWPTGLAASRHVGSSWTRD